MTAKNKAPMPGKAKGAQLKTLLSALYKATPTFTNQFTVLNIPLGSLIRTLAGDSFQR